MRLKSKLATLLLTLNICVVSLEAQEVQLNTQLLTQYRENGLMSVEKLLDESLTQIAYWENVTQDKTTQFGYFESYSTLLVCDKSLSTLEMYKKEHNRFSKLQTFSAYTGKNKGDKSCEGDLKTPVGVYKLTRKLQNVDPFYGPLAFVTSYPNLYDKYKGKTGKGIWIHGLPLHQERDRFTKGCIAIQNENLENLQEKIDLNDTLLIINEDSNNAPSQQDLHHEISLILATLYKWRYAWLYNDLQSYLSFYDESFQRFDGMDKQQFARYKKRVFAKKEKKTIRFSEVNIIPYPQEENMYKISFKEYYKTKSYHFTGLKTLFVKLHDNTFTILTEQ